MAKNRTDLVHEALRNLGALPEGHTPGAEEFNSVARKIDGLVDRLADREVVHIVDVDALPDRMLEPLAVVLAHACQAAWGVDLTNELYAAEQMLREMDRSGPTYEIAKGLYF